MEKHKKELKITKILLCPGYDFKLQPVARLQIERSEVVGNVELPLNYHCSHRPVGWFLPGRVLFRLKRTFNVNSVTQN